MLIDGNIMRALRRIKKSPNDASHLVDEDYREELVDMIADSGSQFDIGNEFRKSYKLVQDYINRLSTIDGEDDLKVIREAQKFLAFILKNEEKLASIEAVKAFKEAVLEVLDEESDELRDRVITRLAN